MTTVLTVITLIVFPLVGVAIVLRAMRKPDQDDYFDNPDHWGAV